MSKVSVIIPVYNASAYLKRCLDSVCNQSLLDIEIICVNDCSNDDSLQILNEYRNKYSNLKIIDCKLNGGESKARNIGLAHVTGEYIGFVDNDDEIDLDFYEKLYNKAITTNADIVKGNVIETSVNGVSSFSHINNEISESKWCFHYEWWSAIYRTKIVKKNNILLLEGFPLGSDVYFLHKILFYAKKVELVNDVFYHWIRRENSGESVILPYEKIQSALRIFKFIQDDINTWYKNNQLDIKNYNYISKNCLNTAFSYIFRNSSTNCRKICCEYAKLYYLSCVEKKALEEYSMKVNPYLFSCLKFDKFDKFVSKVLELKDLSMLDKKNIFTLLRLQKGKQNV